jgi:hypothetical protein
MWVQVVEVPNPRCDTASCAVPGNSLYWRIMTERP